MRMTNSCMINFCRTSLKRHAGLLMFPCCCGCSPDMITLTFSLPPSSMITSAIMLKLLISHEGWRIPETSVECSPYLYNPLMQLVFWYELCWDKTWCTSSQDVPPSTKFVIWIGVWALSLSCILFCATWFSSYIHIFGHRLVVELHIS